MRRKHTCHCTVKQNVPHENAAEDLCKLGKDCTKKDHVVVIMGRPQNSLDNNYYCSTEMISTALQKEQETQMLELWTGMLEARIYDLTVPWWGVMSHWWHWCGLYSEEKYSTYELYINSPGKGRLMHLVVWQISGTWCAIMRALYMSLCMLQHLLFHLQIKSTTGTSSRRPQIFQKSHSHLTVLSATIWS